MLEFHCPVLCEILGFVKEQVATIPPPHPVGPLHCLPYQRILGGGQCPDCCCRWLTLRDCSLFRPVFHHRRGAGSRLQDRGFHGDHHSNHPADPGGPVLVLQLEAGDRGGHISVHPGGKLTGLLHPSLRGFRGC